MVRWRIRFCGKVQHVGFRYTAYTLARHFGLTGWVDNLDDESVAMEIQGESGQLRRFLLELKRKPNLQISE